jgi:uncharacterized membrane protein YfcA
MTAQPGLRIPERLFLSAVLAFFFLSCPALLLAQEKPDPLIQPTLSFSARFRWKTVILGVLIATIVISLISTLLGNVLGTALPFFWINLLTGLAFIAFGLWALRSDESPHRQLSVGHHLTPMLTLAIAFFVAVTFFMASPPSPPRATVACRPDCPAS